MLRGMPKIVASATPESRTERRASSPPPIGMIETSRSGCKPKCLMASLASSVAFPPGERGWHDDDLQLDALILVKSFLQCRIERKKNDACGRDAHAELFGGRLTPSR